MDFAQEEPGVAMEIIRALGKELKEARDRIRLLENEVASRAPTPNTSRRVRSLPLFASELCVYRVEGK